MKEKDEERFKILKDIFVEDQYKRIHFLSLYLEAFTIPSNKYYFSELKDEEKR
jgi:hypothetical protein